MTNLLYHQYLTNLRSDENQPGLSPGKFADLHMKNLQQLRYLQQLHDDNILSDTEFKEQKQIVLSALRKL